MIRGWHLQRGWKDVGYHYFIGFDGKLEAGRDLDVIGAHVEGHNTDSVGICLAGLEVKDFTANQFDSLKMLFRLLKRVYPKASLHGHHEFNPHKDCPVFDVAPLQKYWSAL